MSKGKHRFGDVDAGQGVQDPPPLQVGHGPGLTSPSLANTPKWTNQEKQNNHARRTTGIPSTLTTSRLCSLLIAEAPAPQYSES